MVYDYLAAMGYADPARVQQEAADSDLSCLIRFYRGELGSGAAGGCPAFFRLILLPAELVDIPLWVLPAPEKRRPEPAEHSLPPPAETRHLLRI